MNYTIENYIDAFIAKLKIELNTQITAINIANGDTLLSTLASDAYFYKKDNSKAKTYSQYFYYEPYEDVALNAIDYGGVYSINYVFECGIIFQQNNRYADNDETNFRMVMRYQEALKEAIRIVSAKLRTYGNIQINSIKSSNEVRAERNYHRSSFNLTINKQG